MAIKATEISDLIKQRIENFKAVTEARNVGSIVSVTDGITRIHGLADACYGEMLEFPGNTFGLALNLEQDSVGAVVLGEYKHLKEGDTVKTTGRILEVPVGRGLLGRVVDALGLPIDGKGPVKAERTSPIERVAPGVIYRQSVSQPVQTGYKAIDAMVPIGRGQRELIIGDRQTGKTALAVDTIINQKTSGIKCIYVAIGQKQSTIANVVRKLEEHGALAHTVVVAASASVPPALQYISAYSGVTMGEYFMDKGEDALIIYDDLSKQAVAYRQIFLETDLFNAGIRPAMNAGISVSRVGGAAQTDIIKKLGGGIRLSLAQYRELAAFSQFASDLDEATRRQLERGQRVTEVMKQKQYAPMSVAEMALAIYAVNNGYLDKVDLKKVVAFETALQAFAHTGHHGMLDAINSAPKLTKENEAAMKKCIEDFVATGTY